MTLVKTRLELLSTNWTKFENNLEELLSYVSDPTVRNDVHFTEDLFSTCQEAYIDARCTMWDLHCELEKDGSEPTSNVSGQATSFPVIGPSLVISNTDLTPVEKLQYLKNSLGGDAHQVISGIPVTGINFSRAWTRLVSRYENKRVLIQSYFKMLFSLRPMTKRSAKELEKLRATVTEVEEPLTTLCSNEER